MELFAEQMLASSDNPGKPCSHLLLVKKSISMNRHILLLAQLASFTLQLNLSIWSVSKVVQPKSMLPLFDVTQKTLYKSPSFSAQGEYIL